MAWKRGIKTRPLFSPQALGGVATHPEYDGERASRAEETPFGGNFIRRFGVAMSRALITGSDVGTAAETGCRSSRRR